MTKEENNNTENNALNISFVVSFLQNLERYEILGGMGVNEGLVAPEQDANGDWVKFEEIEELLKKLKLFATNNIIERAFNAGRERLTHPDWDFVYDDYKDYIKKNDL